MAVNAIADAFGLACDLLSFFVEENRGSPKRAQYGNHLIFVSCRASPDRVACDRFVCSATRRMKP
jgi:hypothetical protein